MIDQPTPLVSAPPVLRDRAGLHTTVTRLAGEITRDHPDGVLLIGVLKGALIFLADLARAITDVDVQIDFMAISRYAPDSGRVRILKDVEIDVTGRDVIIVEDMVDTGLTLAYLRHHLEERSPRRVEVCTLLDRSARRIVPTEVRYVGEEIGGEVFVLGFGLHHLELYRNLPFIVEADRTVLYERPDAYVDVLYPGRAGRPNGGRPASGRRSGGGRAGEARW